MLLWKELFFLLLLEIVCHVISDDTDTINNRNVGIKTPNSYVNFDDFEFDGECFNGVPPLKVIGDVKQGNGIHDRALKLSQYGSLKEPASCVVAENIPDECPFNAFKCTEGITYSMWLRFNTHENGTRLGSCSTFLSMGGSFLSVSDAIVGNLKFISFNVGGVFSFCRDADIILEPVLEKWGHVVYILEGPGSRRRPRLLINGKNAIDMQTACNHFEIGIDLFDKKMNVGCLPTESGSTCGFDGRIDDLRVYNRTLTDKEIELLGDPDRIWPPRKRKKCRATDELNSDK